MRCHLAIVVLLTLSHLFGSYGVLCGEEVALLSETKVQRVEHPREQMVRRIDEVLNYQWQGASIDPAQPATDGEFLRRAYLDLNGVIPRVNEVRRFLADENPNKRQLLVEQLLRSPRYATHMAGVWHNRILPQGTEASNAAESIGLQKWLRTRFAKNLRYDGLVAELLLVTGEDELGPGLYFQANELAPEKLAASVSELFLGVKLQCAQCHDHPYSEWSQRDFWGLAAFFAQVQASGNSGMRNMSYRLVDTGSGEVQIPDTEEVVPPKYPRSDAEFDNSFGSRRASLVLWLTSRDNPLFARAGVNWAWTHLFGQGLVEAVDQKGADSSLANDQLLDDLADYFVDSGFDLQELMGTLCSTRVYQLSSHHDDPASATPELFARYLPKPLTPEQLYDSFVLLSPTTRSNAPIFGASNLAEVDADPMRTEFLLRMREPPGSPTEYRAGTLQALMLMNGQATAQLTTHQQSRLLGALAAPFLDEDDRVEALFLATLCRQPTSEEQAMCIETLKDGVTEEDQSRILSDVLWALVNSTEFAFNR